MMATLCDGRPTPWQTLLFTAAIAAGLLPRLTSADSLRLLAVGDVGGSASPPYTTSLQLGVAGALAVKAAQTNATATLLLGNNFLPDGISCRSDPIKACTTDVTSHRFADTFASVYTSMPPLFYAAMGASDCGPAANISAQIEYGRAVNERWVLPDLYYDRILTFELDGVGNGSARVHLFFINTPIFNGSDAPAAAAQLAWLTSTMAATTAEWVIVIGSAPIWGVGEAGPTASLIAAVKPLLEVHGAALYISGGDHALQHLAEGLGPEYVVSGVGSRVSPSRSHNASVPAGSLKYFGAPPSGGFVYLEFTGRAIVSMQWVDGESVVCGNRQMMALAG